MPSWSFVLNQSSVEVLLETRRTERIRLIEFFRALSEDPCQQGDFEAFDDTGRPIQIKVVGRFLVTYWADQSCRELRVLQIERA